MVSQSVRMITIRDATTLKNIDPNILEVILYYYVKRFTVLYGPWDKKFNNVTDNQSLT